jgi:hypothetical protein
MLLGGALAVALSACAGASGPTAYEKKAADAASQVVAAARTVLLAARAADDGGAFQQTGAVTIADAESDATAARAAFAAVQPPDPGADQLRAEVLPELERAVDAIGLVRIAAQRGGASLQEVAAPLNALAAGLDQVAWAYG